MSNKLLLSFSSFESTSQSLSSLLVSLEIPLEEEEVEHKFSQSLMYIVSPCVTNTSNEPPYLLRCNFVRSLSTKAAVEGPNHSPGNLSYLLPHWTK